MALREPDGVGAEADAPVGAEVGALALDDAPDAGAELETARAPKSSALLKVVHELLAGVRGT